MENKNSGFLAMLTAIFVAAFILKFVFEAFKLKKPKKDLADEYSISKPTFSKWIENFQNVISIEEWKKRRKLTGWEIIRIKIAFGTDTKYVLSKGQIAEIAESNPKTVAECVIKRIDEIGITQEAWETLNVFPPVISKRILKILG